MAVKYPSTWVSGYGENPYNKQGNLTPVGAEWSTQLAQLSNADIKAGIDSLSNREEKRFPPNAMEFRELCIGSEYENALDAIICRLQSGDSYQWKNQLAFNIFIYSSADLKMAKMEKVPSIVKRILNMIDKSSMQPLPDYSKPVIEKPKQEKGIAPEKQRRIFQSHMHGAIFRHKPELFKEPEDHKKQKYTNRDINSKLPPLMQKIFSPRGTTDLINKFKASGYIMPDRPLKPDFMDFSKSEWSVKYNSYKSKAIEAMTNFLNEEKIL